MNFLKQLFCKHIWKLNDKIYLDSVIRAVMGVPIYITKNYMDVLKCVKCGKLKRESNPYTRMYSKTEQLELFKKNSNLE